MQSRTSQILFRYWNEVRGSRIAPTRLEIEPARITQILSETFILEAAEIGGYLFRLAGTRICEHLGYELRGCDFLDIAGEEHAPVLEQIMGEVTSKGAVATIEVEMSALDDRVVRFEIMVLPLVHGKQTVSRYLGSITAIDAPAWLGTVVLQPLRLVDHELHWPDGRPHAVVERSGNQTPFVPAMVGARVVRQDRRQFRVLQGGLAAVGFGRRRDNE